MPLHGDALVHAPFALQVWGVLLLHWVCMGAHEPVHDPFTHVEFMHATAVPHMPLVSHVSTPLFEHCVAPWAQTPVHLPFTHVVF
jgi:hypothetical protein